MGGVICVLRILKIAFFQIVPHLRHTLEEEVKGFKSADHAGQFKGHGLLIHVFRASLPNIFLVQLKSAQVRL